MRKEFIKWRLVRLLDKIQDEKDWTPERYEFLDYVVKNKWLWFKHIFDSEKEFCIKMGKAIDDCIAKGYIEFDDTPEKLRKQYLLQNGENMGGISELALNVLTNKFLIVKTNGRDFLTQNRFEIFFKHNARTSKYFATFILSGVFWVGIRYAYNSLAINFGWPIW